MRAAIYTRISRDDTGDALGVARQELDCRALAERLGWTVVEHYSDNDVSAYSGKRRPEYRRMVAALEAGALDAVIAYRADRLYRSVFVDLSELIGVIDRTGVTIRTVASGEIDLATADGRMTATIVASVAEAESRRQGERLRRQREQQAGEGRRQGGGRRPFGYTSSSMAELEPAEASLIREAVDALLSGSSLYSITTAWNRAGVKTAGGSAWKPANLRRVLMSAHIAGLREHKRTGTVTPASWPALVTPAEHDLLNARLASERNTTGERLRRRTALLSGLLRCSECGTKLIASAGRYYCDRGRSGGCGAVRVNDGRALEREVLIRAEAAARGKRQNRPVRVDAATVALEEMRGLSAQLEELAEMWAAGEISRNDRNRQRVALNDRIAALEDELRELGEPTDEYVERLNDALDQWLGDGPMSSTDITLLQPTISAALGTELYVEPRPRRTPFAPEQLRVGR